MFVMVTVRRGAASTDRHPSIFFNIFIMKFDSRIDSERVVIVSALLIGWALWTAWRHLILPALIAGAGLLLLATGWRPEPAPVPYSSAAMALAACPVIDPVIDGAMESMVISARVRRAAIGLALHAPSPDLPPAVRQQIRASLDRLSRDG